VHNLVCYGLCRKLVKPRAAIDLKSKDGFFAKWAALFSKRKCTQKEIRGSVWYSVRQTIRWKLPSGEENELACRGSAWSVRILRVVGEEAFGVPGQRIDRNVGLRQPTTSGSKAFAFPPRRPCKWGNSDCDQTIQSCQWIVGMLTMSTEARSVAKR
jgi:hypothetical protein